MFFKKSFFFIFLLLIGMSHSYSQTFEFYGDGIAEERTKSFSLACDYGESQTAFVTYHHLRPGYYKVKATIRALDVQNGKEGYSFWHFYDGGFGVKSVFSDLFGSYGTRVVEYQVQVKNSDLTLWFRLKSPGKIFVDAVNIESALYGNPDIKISDSTPFREEKQLLITKNSKLADFARVHLFNFDRAEIAHPFDLQKDAKNGGVGILKTHRYYNFVPEKFKILDWSDFDRIELDLYNPNEDYALFNFTMADDLTTNYWGQLNHNESLAPGWNHVILSLRQFVGERGSVRYLRSLHLDKIKKLFVGIDPEGKIKFTKDTFYIDNIDLVREKMPAPPKEVMAFDFTSHKATPNSFVAVTTQSLFNKERGYGFINPQFWRVEDSFSPSSYFRYSIGITEGKFRVEVPNGKYKFELVADKLGLWDVPFFSDRMLLVNGHPVFKETRNNGGDFLADFLRFEKTIPSLTDHPFTLYIDKILKPISGVVEIKNGVIDFEFLGDASGLSLNTLILWDQKNTSIANAYIRKFQKRNIAEFNWQTRLIGQRSSTAYSEKLEINPIAMTKQLNPAIPHLPLGRQLFFQAGQNEKVSQLLQVNPLKENGKINFKIGSFRNVKHEIVKNISLKVSEVVNQFVSPGTSHETYFLNGTYLKELKEGSFLVEAKAFKFLWIDVQADPHLVAGTFYSNLEFTYHHQLFVIPVELIIAPYELPKINFPVGFMGLDPLPYSYFRGGGWKELRKKYRFLALKKLSEAGFSTFSGLPEVPLITSKGRFDLDTLELNETILEAKRLGFTGPLFSYGGQFPEGLLKSQNLALNMKEEDYYQRLSKLLKPFVGPEKSFNIVYLFSDEASGYSQKIEEDYQFGLKIKKYFPYLSMGGFGAYEKSNPKLESLNRLFDFGFFSSLSVEDIKRLQNQKLKWGFYNAVPTNLDDPRFAFGAGLFLARKNGLSHYLEWNSIGFNQYPYFDFDGRESDIVLFYPSANGGLQTSVRFELARVGLATFRKLMLLEDLIKKPNASAVLVKEAQEFIQNIERSYRFNPSKSFLSTKAPLLDRLNSDLDKLLLKISKNE